MYTSYGLGVDQDVIGAYVAFGFGKLELFPEGLIAIINDIVYEELREIKIPKDSRGIKIRKEEIC